MLFGQGTGSFASPRELRASAQVRTPSDSATSTATATPTSSPRTTARTTSASCSAPATGTFGAATSYPTGPGAEGSSRRRLQRRREARHRDGEHGGQLSVGRFESRRRPDQPASRHGHGRVRGRHELHGRQHAVLGRSRTVQRRRPADVATANWFGNNVSVLVNTTNSIAPPGHDIPLRHHLDLDDQRLGAG